jgi:hypothetical protein
MRSVAIVETAHAARYMGQLVKHFGHKIPTELTATTGRIEFPFGVCTAQAGEALTLTCEAPADTLEQLQGVIERHLVRFAFRENELAVVWGAPQP